MSNKEPGYVYILTNPSSREDWVKIGKSSRPVDAISEALAQLQSNNHSFVAPFWDLANQAIRNNHNSLSPSKPMG